MKPLSILLILLMTFTSCSKDDKANNEGSLSTPKTITVGQAFSGQIGSHGVSYYKFTISSPQTYSIILNNLESNLLVQLFDDMNYETLLNTNDDNDGDGQVIMWDGMSAKTYYLQVNEWDGKAGTFTININVY
ncbi:hypothetical protein F9K33_16140 [bacterium]|nr:MAG: hypothetical protein F9K33_16140 [bacterium]